MFYIFILIFISILFFSSKLPAVRIVDDSKYNSLCYSWNSNRPWIGSSTFEACDKLVQSNKMLSLVPIANFKIAFQRPWTFQFFIYLEHLYRLMNISLTLQVLAMGRSKFYLNSNETSKKLINCSSER